MSRTVTWWEPKVLVEGGEGLSGLDFLRAVRDGDLPPAPIAAVFAFSAEVVEEGMVVFTCRPDTSAYNPIGTVHGGLMCTLADSVAGCAVHTTLPVGTRYTTIDITVNFLRPVTAASGVLRATGTVVKPGRSVATAAVEVADAAGKLVATATSNCLILSP